MNRVRVYHDLAAALRLGAEPVEAASFLESIGGRRREALLGALREGAGLAPSLDTAFPNAFPPWELALIHAAERTEEVGGAANLAEVVGRLGDRARTARVLRGRIGGSLVYAAVVLCALCAASVLAAEIVLPPLAAAAEIVTLTEAAGINRAVTAARRLPFAIGGGALLGAGVVAAVRVGLPRAGGVRLLPGRLRAALAGVLPGSDALVTVMRLTFAAGGDVAEAVELARRAGALPDRRDADALLRAAASGAPIAPVVARCGLLPRHLAGRLAAAERAGDVAGALPAIATALQLRRSAAVEAAPRAVAAATTCAVGGVLLWFALEVVIPALTAVAAAPGAGR